MTPITLLIIVLILSSVFYFVGRKRAFTVAGGKGARGLHSLPTYYGALTAMWCAIPALLVFCLWQMFETAIVTNLVIGDLPDQMVEHPLALAVGHQPKRQRQHAGSL